MKKKSVVFSTIGGVIGGFCGGLLYPFIKHWNPLLLWGSILCVLVLYLVLSAKFDKDETPRESFSEFKERKMLEKELKKRHQHEENENA